MHSTDKRGSAIAAAFIVILLFSTRAAADTLDQPVTLRSESDLLTAVSATLQHAIATSQQYRGDVPRLQRFARTEIKVRREGLRQLDKLGGVAPRNLKQGTIASADEQAYVQAMLRNHARLNELIEHGMGLPLSKPTKRIMEQLARSAAAEFAMLSKLALS